MNTVWDALGIIAIGAYGLAIVVVIGCAILIDIVKPELVPPLRKIVDRTGLAMGVTSAAGAAVVVVVWIWSLGIAAIGVVVGIWHRVA